jgi:hypothetical protein
MIGVIRQRLRIESSGGIAINVVDLSGSADRLNATDTVIAEPV